MIDYANDEVAVEVETFALAPREPYRRYGFLEAMPKGAHVHFRDHPKNLRATISSINQRLARQGSEIHFSVRRVGADDPKGIGLRVLRDDLQVKKVHGEVKS